MTDDLFPDRVTFAVDPSLEELVKLREAWETPPEVPEAVLWAELLTHEVWDPCCGTGAISRVLRAHGHSVISTDLEDWGYGPSESGVDFLKTKTLRAPTVFMNPPFSLAEAFVAHTLQLGARKLIVIQRRAWWEGETREREFWSRYRPNRIYTPVPRPGFWMFHIPLDERKGGGQTCHDVYVFEPRHPVGTLSGHLRMTCRQPAFEARGGGG